MPTRDLFAVTNLVVIYYILLIVNRSKVLLAGCRSRKYKLTHYTRRCAYLNHMIIHVE